MRRISILERSLGQLALQPSKPVCRSCRLQVAGPQRRQIQSTVQRRAGGGLVEGLKSTIFGKNPQGAKSKSVKSQGTSSKWPKRADMDPNYIEATTWDGLERVGSDAWVEDQFDPYDNYEGWTKVDTSRKFDAQEVEKVLLPIVNEVVSARAQGQNQQAIPTSGDGWSRYKLSDPAIKFGISKLLLQREGVRITDFALNRAETLSDIRQILITKPQAKKLADHLREEEEIKDMANIKVHSRRVTPIDKEKAVGRWKVIEQELIDRGLPVTGHSGRAKKAQAQAEE